MKRIALRNRIRRRAARVLAAAFLRRIPPGRPRRALLLYGFQLIGDGGFGNHLHRQIDRREHAETALVDALPAESIHELAPHLFLEVLPVRLFSAQRVVENGL